MDITITINTDNAAFEDDPDEFGRILRHLADMGQRGNYDAMDGKRIMDANGNKVGQVTITR
jgi:hypothetical protein